MAEWEMRGHYETVVGDRVTLLELNGHWAVLWSYAYPHNGTQLVSYGEHGGKAVDVFTTSRERESLAFDSRQRWMNGSI